MARHADAGVRTGRRVVLFPLPFRSHITPMLQLAEVLRGRGLAVTVLHTDFNAPDDAVRHPELTFVSIHESLPDAVANRGADIVEQMMGLNTACEAPFKEALASLLQAEDPPDIACAVIDAQMYVMLGAATEVGVPVLALRTDSAATFHSMLADQHLCVTGPAPVKEEELDMLVPGLEPLRARDRIHIDGIDMETVRRFIACVSDATWASASGVVLNTFGVIKASQLARIQHELSCPAFGVGPLHLLSPVPVEHGLHAPDRGCLAWLDAHLPHSVLYVSLGSVARIDRCVFEEMAWGLADSGVPFLWVVRPGFLSGIEEAPPFPEGFRDAVRRDGKVVTWVPQREVLAHPTIDRFWTHGGWNSTLESVCEGVPMLVQPCFADQTVNARYVTHQWGVGLEVGEVIERATVAKAVQSLMVGEEGAMVRDMARHLKVQACQYIAEGESASVAIDNLVEHMLSL